MATILLQMVVISQVSYLKFCVPGACNLYRERATWAAISVSCTVSHSVGVSCLQDARDAASDQLDEWALSLQVLRGRFEGHTCGSRISNKYDNPVPEGVTQPPKGAHGPKRLSDSEHLRQALSQ